MICQKQHYHYVKILKSIEILPILPLHYFIVYITIDTVKKLSTEEKSLMRLLKLSFILLT